MIIRPTGNRTLADLLAEQAELHADRDAFVFESENGVVDTFSYAALDAAVNRTAHGFTAAGVRRGDRVVVHLRNSVPGVLTFLALAKLGAIFVPTNAANTARELGYVVRATAPVAILSEESLAAVVEDALEHEVRPLLICARGSLVDGGWIDFAELVADQPTTPPGADIEPLDVCEIIFTSGTTADPKGVMLTHANMLTAGVRESADVRMTRADRSVTARPVFHVNFQTKTLMSSLTCGAAAVLLETYHASRFIEQLVRHEATMTTLGPAFIRTMLAQPPSPLDRAHRLRDCSSAINPTDEEVAEFEQRFGIALINGYGLSEAITSVCCAGLDCVRSWPSIGRPTLDRAIRLVGDDGEDVEVGEPGEILVRGEPGWSLMLGYYNQPELTEQALEGGWLRTGDLAVSDAKGNLYFYDRKKDVVKRGGENISASEVESVLMTNPNVSDVAVIGVPHPIYEETPVAFVVLKDNSADDPASLSDWASQHLASFKVPTGWHVLDELPRRGFGPKVNKAELRRAAAGTIDVFRPGTTEDSGEKVQA